MTLTSGEKVRCAEGNPIHNNYSQRLCQLINTIIIGFALGINRGAHLNVIQKS